MNIKNIPNKGLLAVVNIVLPILFCVLASGQFQDFLGVHPAEAATVSGEKKILVLLANYSDLPLDCTRQEVQDLMFTDPNNHSVSQFYAETSMGNIHLTGDVYGPYTINAPSTADCDEPAWAAEVKSQALQAGIDPSAYASTYYVFPPQNNNSNVCFPGMSIVYNKSIYITRCSMGDVYTHELGHNIFGMGHASTPSSLYGDNSDIMGSGGSGLKGFNAPHKVQVGWESEPSRVKTITTSGDYEVAPLELTSSQTSRPVILKVAKPDTNENYFVSYRQPIGFDINMWPSFHESLSLHTHDGTVDSTVLLSQIRDTYSYIDPINSITFTAKNHNSDYYTVGVRFGPPGCVTFNPKVTVTPSEQTALAGHPLSYQVSVTNNNTADCPPATYNLSVGNLPTSWTTSFFPDKLTIASGSSSDSTVTVTSALPAQLYTMIVYATDSQDPSRMARGNANITVTTDSIAPAAPQGLVVK